MREEVISSGGAFDPLVLARSSSSPSTPAASSAGASSPAVPTNVVGSAIDLLSYGKEGSQRTSFSTSPGDSAFGSSQISCRPWEREDLLRRLDTYNPVNWSGKPKVASSLACARRGWVNVGVNKIVCESCGANLNFVLPSWNFTEADGIGEEFSKQLDARHKVSCPWRGITCADSLVQFPPIPPSALIGGFKDRCDGLLQFLSLPVIAASAVQQMRASRCAQLDRLLSGSQVVIPAESSFKAEGIAGVESAQEEAFCSYSDAQKLISLCGWEPRWLPNIQDCEEHSAQSARDGCSSSPTKDRFRLSQNSVHNKVTFPPTAKKDLGKKNKLYPELRCESRSPMLDCSLCGATLRIWNFISVPRPVRFVPNLDTTVTSKKMTLIRGASAASGVSGWVAADCVEKDQTELRDEVATHDAPLGIGVDLNLTMAAGVLQQSFFQPPRSEQFQDAAAIGQDLRIGQPSGSVGDRAASYESRGPSTTHKRRSMEGGGSTVDRPLNTRMHQADSVEGTVIDRDGEEVNDGSQYSAGPSKRVWEAEIFSANRRDSSGAGPSNSVGFEIDIDANRSVSYVRPENSDQFNGDLARASSVIAMDTVGGHDSNDDSMESVENHPADLVDFQFSSPGLDRNIDSNNASELNFSNQAQQSRFFFFQSSAGGIAGAGGSSTNDGEEILNGESGIIAPPMMNTGGISFGMSAGGSIERGVPSHEAEIHGNAISFQDRATNSVGGEVEPLAEVTENQGQTGESAPCPAGLLIMEDEIDHQGDSVEDVMSIRSSIRKEDSGSKVDDSIKETGDSVESGGEKISHSHTHQDNSAHPSLSCNAMVYSGYEASKEEVTQTVKASSVNIQWDSNYVPAGAPIEESNGEEAVEFDPIKHHNVFCPWVNGNVAAAGCSSSSGGSSSLSGSIALCGWKLTIDALDAFQSLDQIGVQTLQSESAASLYKDNDLNPSQKVRASANKSHRKN